MRKEIKIEASACVHDVKDDVVIFRAYNLESPETGLQDPNSIAFVRFTISDAERYYYNSLDRMNGGHFIKFKGNVVVTIEPEYCEGIRAIVYDTESLKFTEANSEAA